MEQTRTTELVAASWYWRRGKRVPKVMELLQNFPKEKVQTTRLLIWQLFGKNGPWRAQGTLSWYGSAWMTQWTWGMLTQRQKSLRAREAVYLQKGELQKGGCNSTEGISPWCGLLQASQGQGDEQITWPSPLYQSTERKEGSKKTYYTKDELWTTDNSNCTQQQLCVFYTFTDPSCEKIRISGLLVQVGQSTYEAAGRNARFL